MEADLGGRRVVVEDLDRRAPDVGLGAREEVLPAQAHRKVLEAPVFWDLGLRFQILYFRIQDLSLI